MERFREVLTPNEQGLALPTVTGPSESPYCVLTLSIGYNEVRFSVRRKSPRALLLVS